MQCTSPVRIQLPVNAGIRNAKYPEGLEVPCGKCLSCRIKKRSEWTLRMLHELHYHKDSCFVTLTYDDEHLPSNGSLVKKDLQDYFKRLRRNIEPRKIRYFACGEYGDKYNRPHYHYICFGLSLLDRNVINQSWRRGFVHVGLAEPDSIRYVAQYIDKKFTGEEADKVYTQTGREPVFRLLSQGIGRQYCDQYQEQIKQHGFVTLRGKKVSIPRYYIKRLNIDVAEIEQHATENDIKTVQHYTGIDVTSDELYMRYSADDNRRLIEGRKSARHQHDINEKARIAQRNSKL